MAGEVDKEKMQKRLQDANLYEANMPNDMLIQIYNALKDSETSMHEESMRQSFFDKEGEKSLNESANELLEAINNSESIAPSQKRAKTQSESSGSMDDFELVPNSGSSKVSRDELAMIEEESNNNNNVQIGKEKASQKEMKTKSKGDAIKDINKISFNDMPESDKSQKNMLKITCHQLKYVAIQNTKSFITGSTEMRVKMIRSYHRAVEKMRTQYARSSSVRAPVGKPIVFLDFDSSFDFGTSMDVGGKSNEDETKLPTYISRSGRITKRKVYSYEEQDDSSQDSTVASKHIKNNEEWLSKGKPKEKTSKPPVKKFNFGENNKENCTGGSQILKNNRSESPESTFNSEELTLTSFLDEKDPDTDAFDALKGSPIITSSTQSTKPQRPPQKKKQSNNDIIMSRSSLFKDSPKSSRTNAILNAAKEETEKKKQQEDEMERFNISLKESQVFDNEPDELVDVESVVERRRIVPPLPGRKAVNSRKRNAENDINAPEALNIVTKKPHLNTSDASKPTTVNGVSKKTVTVKRSEPSTLKAATPKKNVEMTPCPLCSISFPKGKIVEHAATCGEEVFPQTVQTQRITCDICDCVLMCTKDLEEHERGCRKRRSLLK